MLKQKFIYGFILSLYFSLPAVLGQSIYSTNQVEIDFISDAPLEIIKASSENCRGVLNIDSGEFIFSVFIKTFDGFNNPLQKIHFQENYLEVAAYPDASFTGRIIDQFQFKKLQPQRIRAKGDLLIHGVSVERIIPVDLTVTGDTVSFSSSFKILLEDHLINIPRIVRQKISEEINVSIKGVLKPVE